MAAETSLSRATPWLVTFFCLFAGLGVWSNYWGAFLTDASYLSENQVRFWQAASLADGLAGIPLCVAVGFLARVSVPTRSQGLAALAVAMVGLAVVVAAIPAGLVLVAIIASWPGRRWLAAALILQFLVLFLPDPRDAINAGTLQQYVLVRVVSMLLLLLPVLIGRWIRQRRELDRAYRQRANAADREREQSTAAVRAHEREAIARDLHDTLSHRLALISLHANVLEQRNSLQEDGRQTVGVIRQSAQAAVEDLHAVLTVLREPQGQVAPAHEIADIDAIVTDAAHADTHVFVDLPADLRDRLVNLRRVRSVALGRCVHEGIVNAGKHAHGQLVRVGLSDTGDGVQVDVRNSLASDPMSRLPGGYGLVGLEERIATAHGRLTAGVEGTEFVLRAWVPWG